MLKGIPSFISPKRLKVLMEMGHSDEIVIADGNFPAASVTQWLIRSDGNNVPELLDAILKFFPLDTFVDHLAALMDVLPGDMYKPVIWDEYREIISRHDETFTDFELVERFVFYDRAEEAYAVIATSEMARYANIILKKCIL
jgi:L-fucose mutarotase